ncbi:MAG: adenine nucleotide alpha hydrolase family protein [Nitrospirae bacterium]|nr:MAG: adenine nucleotide alpha hydrolase family protein [Nitrospirota bacterium]
MRCRKCPRRAVINLARHRLALCPACFTDFVHQQVARAIKRERMFGPQERVLVAVSGGKDSLALWAILLKLGYRADALYVDLGIGEYSARSYAKVQAFAEQAHRDAQARLYVHRVPQKEGAGIRELAILTHRPTCSACGTLKRYHFNRIALEHHYDVLATGHNLDDEAARLLGNILHWQTEYLDKQAPTLPASVEGFARKVKPLYRLTEREIAAYAVINRIDYVVEECPMAKGSKLLLYKEILNQLETAQPGTKHRFYWGFLEKRAHLQGTNNLSMAEYDRQVLTPCTVCGQPTTAPICTYCKLMDRAKGVPVKSS